METIKCPSPNLIGAYEQFTKETGKKEIRLGEVLEWLQKNTEKNEVRRCHTI